MSGFRYDPDGRWVDGRIYDPNSGDTYKGTIRQVDANTLKLRRDVGLSLFGRTETWTRDEGTQAALCNAVYPVAFSRFL